MTKKLFIQPISQIEHISMESIILVSSGSENSFDLHNIESEQW